MYKFNELSTRKNWKVFRRTKFKFKIWIQYEDKRYTPFMRFKIKATVSLRVGCNMGPITMPGFIETMSMSLDLQNLQAASSAKIFEMIYHFCTNTNKSPVSSNFLCQITMLDFAINKGIE